MVLNVLIKMKTQLYAAPAVKGLKQLGRFALPSHNMSIVADPTHINVIHAAQRIMTNHLLY